MKRLGPVALACAALLVASSCSLGGVKDAVTPDSKADKPADPVVLTPNVAQKAKDVDVSTVVKISAANGTVERAELTTADGKTQLKGSVSDGSWVASELLEPGTTYRLSATGTNEDGAPKSLTRTFATRDLTLKEQTYPSVAPLEGETVGVGMPVIVTFDVPVKNRELYEEHMKVTSTPAVEGSWSWFSDKEVHFRPRDYWPARAKVNVDLTLNSLPAGDGVYGQQDQDIDFTIGSKVVSVVDVAKHRLTYSVEDKTTKTIPVTTGDAGHQTREGTKVIMEKFSSIDMDAATTGVEVGDAGYYNISDVRYAMRVTNSGEFLHAAPWSVASQGNANVSHGCTGMSTANAKWLYDHSRRGDIVRYTNSPRQLEDRNGWTDWNVPWETWTSRSALPEPAASPSNDSVVG